MQTKTQILPRRLFDSRRLLVAGLAACVLTLGAIIAAHAANVPAITCDGTSTTTRSYDLWAEPNGTFTLADNTTVTVWGYTTDGSVPTAPGGPTLVACAGDTVNVTLHNGLAEDTSLALHGQAGLPADMIGAASGASKTYSFTARPGTFLYQAGLTANGPKQAALGLYGALVVYPANGQAYNANTAFGDDNVLLLSEIDPALNADPVNFDMHDYAPKYWLINGKSYPQTTGITVAAGTNLLLRYVNAGFTEHSMGLLGADQSIIATNGNLYPAAHGAVAETVPPGDTLDALVSAPAGQYPLYDANQHIDNSGADSLGGMMLLITVQ